jgi:YaiO family outer membrane protein
MGARAADGDADGSGTTATHEASATFRIERPDAGLQDWQALRFEWASTHGNWARSWRAAAVAERRFGTTDHGVELGMTHPLDARWLLQSEFGLSPGATFLARHYLDLRLVRRFDHGILATFGIRSSSYRDQHAQRALVTLERYAGDWRLAWTSNVNRIGGHGSPGQELAIDRYFDDRNSLGIRLARGEESIPQPAGGLAFGNTRSVTVLGRYWVRPRWALQYGAGHVAQSGLYDRDWLQLGLQHAW